MSVQTAAGTRLSISANIPATFDSTGYGGSNVIFTEIAEIVAIGEYGRNYALIKHNPIASRSTQKFKGSFDEGQLNLDLGLDIDDAGQAIAKAASISDNNYSFKVVFPNGDIDYFQAQVMNFIKSVPNVDSIVGAKIMLEITSSTAGVGIVSVT